MTWCFLQWFCSFEVRLGMRCFWNVALRLLTWLFLGSGEQKFSAVYLQVCVLSRVQLCDPRDCSTPGSSVHGLSQSRILDWVAIPFSRGFSRPRDQTQVSCFEGRFFYHLSHQRVGCYFILQGISPTQGSNPNLRHLLHWQADSLPLCHPPLIAPTTSCNQVCAK